MADDRIFQALASHDGPADVRDAFADDLFERLVAERRSAMGWSRPQLLLVAALLLTLATATAVVIGSRVVNVPDEDAELPALAAIDCLPARDAGLAPDQVLVADIRVPDQSSGSRPKEQLVLLADGTMLTGRVDGPLVDESSPTARRLSPEGMAMLVGAVMDSRLVAPGCHLDMLDSTPLRGVTVRFADGRVGTTHWGQYGGMTRMLTDGERAAAAALVARLEDLSWLPATAWSDSAGQERQPEDWVVTVIRQPAATEAEYAIENAPPVLSVSAPGGGSLLAFGMEFSDPALRLIEMDGSVTVQEGLVRRCAIVSTADAQALADRLEAAGAFVGGGNWWLADQAELVSVRLEPYSWNQGECARYLAGDRPPPAEIVLPTPEPAPAGLDACGLLSADDVSAALESLSDSSLTTRSGREERGVTYATCFLGPRDGPGVTLYLRPGPVSHQLAAEIATTWLGPEAAASTVNDARFWENACASADHVHCHPVVAVWRNDTLVLVRIESLPGRGREVVDALAPLVAEALDGGTP